MVSDGNSLKETLRHDRGSAVRLPMCVCRCTAGESVCWPCAEEGVAFQQHWWRPAVSMSEDCCAARVGHPQLESAARLASCVRSA